jgi:hypothetical protein
MRMRPLLAASALAAALALAGCGKQADPGQPLAYAPADSVFLLGNLEPVPDAAIDAWWKNSEQMMTMYDRVFDEALEDIEADGADATAIAVAKALREELRGKFNRAGFEGLGFTGGARSAFYGIGLVPVARMELGDADKFRAFVGRVESRAGAKMAEAEVAGQKYWTITGGEAKAGLLMAIQDKHLVVTVAPAAPSEALLKQLLGIERPAADALSAGTLEAFNKARGWLPYGSGYLDTVRLAAALTGERNAIEQEFLRALGVEPASTTTTPECKAEFGAIAAAVPRISFGYAALEAKAMDLRYVVETAPEHGKGMVGLAADVPGLDGRGEGMLDVGFGLDLDAFAGFINLRAAKVAESPFKCEALVSLNDDIAKMNAELANPAVFMAGAAVSGINMSLTNFDLPEAGTPVVTGKIAVGSDNPASLLSMAGGFVPQLASLNLQPGAAPVAMPAGLLPPDAPPAHLALGEKALAISLGAGEEAGLAAFAAAPAGKPAPLMHYGVDSRGMQAFMQAMAKASEAQLAAAEARAAMAEPVDADGDGQPDPGSEESAADEVAELKEAVELFRSMQSAYVDSIERVDFALYATERGLEAHYALKLK